MEKAELDRKFTDFFPQMPLQCSMFIIKRREEEQERLFFQSPLQVVFVGFCHFHMSNFAIFGFIFVFARKKFVVCLVAKVFCSTFALAFQRCGVWLSLKKAIFERIPQTFMQKKQKEFQSEDAQSFYGLLFGKQYVFL